MKTKIFTFLLIIPVVFLVYILIAGVKQPIDEKIYTKKTEKEIIRKLKFIRDLEIAYRSEKGQYTGEWDKLIDFAKNGKFFIIQKTEKEKDSAGVKVPIFIIDTLGTVPVKDSLLKQEDYKGFNIDKIAEIPNSKGKKFSLYAGFVEQGNLTIPVFEAKDIYPINPARGAQFTEKGEPYSVPTLIAHYQKKLKARSDEALEIQKKIRDKGGNEKAPDLKKQLDEISKFINLYTNRIEQLEEKPLKVGSREEATTAGNWE